MTVIPRLRAMSPVRMEVGVHLLAAAVEDSAGADAFVAAVVWRALHRGKAERAPKDQSLSMAEKEDVCLRWPERVCQRWLSTVHSKRRP